MNNKIVIGILAGIVLFLGYSYFSTEPVVAPDESAISEVIEAMEKIDEVAENAGEVEKETITLESTDDRGGSATATRYSDDEFNHSVIAIVSDPKEGKFYEGWLVQKTLGVVSGFYSTGKMEKNEAGEYVLDYKALIDEKAEYSEVVITEETLADGLDGKPEAHIFEGKFE